MKLDSVVPLDDLKVNEAGFVESLAGGHGFVGRLSALGFTPKAEVRMVQNFGHGPVIVLVRGTRIALGRGQARRVLVSRAPQPNQGHGGHHG